MNIIIEYGRVSIDGVEYLPASGPAPPEPFRLTGEHFDVAAQHDKPFEAIKWAHETEATVRELGAWCRAVTGKDPTMPEKPATRKKPEPLVFGEKPKQVEATTPKLF